MKRKYSRIWRNTKDFKVFEDVKHVNENMPGKEVSVVTNSEYEECG